jgi:iron complex outermembrane recepter protein
MAGQRSISSFKSIKLAYRLMPKKTFLKMSLFLIFLICILPVYAPALQGAVISDHNSGINDNKTGLTGYVTDRNDGHAVPFVNVIVEGSKVGAITDVNGHFRLPNIPSGHHTLVISGLGYVTERIEFEVAPGQFAEIRVELDYRGLALDEIVITSSPTARGFRYQPDNVFTSEQLQRRADVSFGEMLDGEPGIAMRSMGPTPSRPVIRGLDGDRILILQNGERMGDLSETAAGHAISLDPLSANRVEVVRGPASLLYGSSAIGGVINLMTADIPDAWDKGPSGVVSLQGASNNNMGAGFGRYTWGSENMAATGRFGYRKAGDVMTPEGMVPSTYMENFDGSFGMGFKNDNLNGGFNLSAGALRYGIPEELDDPDENVEVRIRQQLMQGRLHFRVSDFFDRAQLRVHATRFIQQEVEIELEDGIPDEHIEVEFNKVNVSSTLTLQHRPVWVFDRGAFGLNVYGRKLGVTGEDGFTPNEDRMNLALFTFQEVPLSRKLRFQFGGRLDFLRARALPNDFSDFDLSRSTFVYAGSAGLNLRPSDSWEFGGQIARSHRFPMLEELFAYGPHLCAGLYEIGSVDLKDEIGYGSDLFTRWTNGPLRIEVAGFYNLFHNYIIMMPTGETDEASGLPIVEYTGDRAMMYGGEASASLGIMKGLNAGLSIDYVVGQRRNDERECLPFMPPFRFSGELEYDYGKGWVGTRVRAISRQGRVAPEEDMTDGYTLLDVNAGLRLNTTGQHVIVFRIQNLLDTIYRDHLTRIEERNYPMPGRNFSLAYRWFF